MHGGQDVVFQIKAHAIYIGVAFVRFVVVYEGRIEDTLFGRKIEISLVRVRFSLAEIVKYHFVDVVRVRGHIDARAVLVVVKIVEIYRMQALFPPSKYDYILT